MKGPLPDLKGKNPFTPYNSFTQGTLVFTSCNISRLVTVTVEEDQINTPTCSPGAFIRHTHYTPARQGYQHPPPPEIESVTKMDVKKINGCLLPTPSDRY